MADLNHIIIWTRDKHASVAAASNSKTPTLT